MSILNSKHHLKGWPSQYSPPLQAEKQPLCAHPVENGLLNVCCLLDIVLPVGNIVHKASVPVFFLKQILGGG